MIEADAPKNLVAITAKHLDSDDTIEAVTEVEPPASDLAVRKQLADLVEPLYPDAEFRSFANNAATFLAPKLLIVAVYYPSGDDVDAGIDDEPDQPQLFAA
jgi:hypothetical protein